MSVKPLSSTNLGHKGFTLLEAMIALLIFSIGLLGLAGLQAGGLKSTKIADMRSTAIIAAHDMAARIEANAHGAAGAYNGISKIPSKPADCTTTTSCTTNADVVSWDAYEWETYLKSALPAGSGTVTLLPGKFTIYRITVQWDENGTGKANKSYSMDFQPS